jgi:hypothetical protein
VGWGWSRVWLRRASLRAARTEMLRDRRGGCAQAAVWRAERPSWRANARAVASAATPSPPPRPQSPPACGPTRRSRPPLLMEGDCAGGSRSSPSQSQTARAAWRATAQGGASTAAGEDRSPAHPLLWRSFTTALPEPLRHTPTPPHSSRRRATQQTPTRPATASSATAAACPPPPSLRARRTRRCVPAAPAAANPHATQRR